MKKTCLAFLLFSLPLFAQVSTPSIVATPTTPSGSCTAALPLKLNTPAGKLYSCQNGTVGQVGGGSTPATETHTASSSAALQFTSCLTTGNKVYQVTLSGITVSTNSASLIVQFSTNGGTSYDSTASYKYSDSVLQVGASAGSGVNASGSATGIDLLGAGLASPATPAYSGYFQIYDPASTVNLKNVLGDSIAYNASTPYGVTMRAQYANTAAVNAFQVTVTTGTITTGTVSCTAVAGT